MLVISRLLGEKIYIGSDIILTITDLNRGVVRIGIEAPKNVGVWREELLSVDQRKLIQQEAQRGNLDRA